MAVFGESWHGLGVLLNSYAKRLFAARNRSFMVFASLVGILGAALSGCVFLRPSHSELSLLKSVSAENEQAEMSVDIQPSLLSRQEKAEKSFFGFNAAADDHDALAYAEFPEEYMENSDFTENENEHDETSNKSAGKLPQTVLERNRITRKASKDKTGLKPLAQLLWPVSGSISSPFGMRRGRLHAGIDIRANRGTAILASQSGQVLIASKKKAYGNVVVIGHDHDEQTLYAHMLRMAVRSGQYVDQGDVIGFVGRTGRATGYHLHFETRVRGGVPQNPLRFLPERSTSIARKQAALR